MVYLILKKVKATIDSVKEVDTLNHICMLSKQKGIICNYLDGIFFKEREKYTFLLILQNICQMLIRDVVL
jgi:hypothetical protein